MTIVEETLRSQRQTWREITEQVSKNSTDLPPGLPRRILLFGLGSSYFAAKLTEYALLRDRKRTHRIPVIACNSLAIGTEVMPHGEDWAIAFSHRARTGPTMEALAACDRAGAFTGLICSKEAEVPDWARFSLRTTALEKVEPHTASVTGAICAATSFIMGLPAMEEWDALCSLGDPDLGRMREIAGKGPAIILGEWEGEWVAREGALKLMEMAKVPVRAFGSEEFFHGPRHSAKPKDIIWHVATSKDPRTDQIKAAHRLSVYGNSPLAWMPALIELQWLALATALNLEIDPDTKPAS